MPALGAILWESTDLEGSGRVHAAGSATEVKSGSCPAAVDGLEVQPSDHGRCLFPYHYPDWIFVFHEETCATAGRVLVG